MPVGTGQVLIDQVVPLAVPALKIARILASVVNLSCQTLFGQVQVSGVLLETITQVSLAGQVVVQQVAALPFTGLIPVPGATPDQVCRILEVAVEGITVQFVSDQHIRQTAVIRFVVQTEAGQPPEPQPVSPLFEARPPGTVVFSAEGRTFSTPGLLRN